MLLNTRESQYSRNLIIDLLINILETIAVATDRPTHKS